MNLPETARRAAALLLVLAAVPLSSEPVRAAAPAGERKLDYVATEGTRISVDVSPDGNYLVFDLLGDIYEMPVTGGPARALTSGWAWNQFPRYSPDGRSIAFTSDRGGAEGIWTLDRRSGRLRRWSTGPNLVVRGTWDERGDAIFAFELIDGTRNRLLRIDRKGAAGVIADGALFAFASQATHASTQSRIYYERNDGSLPENGASIHAVDGAGLSQRVIGKPGGAFNPHLSPDGKSLAYVGREQGETALYLRDLATGLDRRLCTCLDRDSQENRGFVYGAGLNMAWSPGGDALYFSAGGGIRKLDVASGTIARIPFSAHVRRTFAPRAAFATPIPSGQAHARNIRWPVDTRRGLVFEAMGDLYLSRNGAVDNLSRSAAHETHPLYDARTDTLYYASWTDAERGSIQALSLADGSIRRLTTIPALYGGLALAPDGRLAFVRTRKPIDQQILLQDHKAFDLVVIEADGERVVTPINALLDVTGSIEGRKEPFVAFAPDGRSLYFTEFDGTQLVLRQIALDGSPARTRYVFPHATQAMLSPDGEWIAFREYHRHYVVRFDALAATPVTVSAQDGLGTVVRVRGETGAFLSWRDSATLQWARGAEYHRIALADILAGRDRAAKHALAVPFTVAVPTATIALTDVRLVTMDPALGVIEGATIVVRGDRIVAVGKEVAIPPDAVVRSLPGRTIMPGIIDVHAHYGAAPSPLQVIEQGVPGLLSMLAFGVTSLVEIYGSDEKDFWLSDMIARGDLIGPRLFSSGTPIYGVRGFRPTTYRDIVSRDDALEHLSYNKASGATAIKEYVNFRRDRRRWIAQAALSLGLNVVGESVGNFPIAMTQVIDGYTGIEHSLGVTPLYEDVARFLAAADAGVTPTLIVVYNGTLGEAAFNAERPGDNPRLSRFLTYAQLQREAGRPKPPAVDDGYAAVAAAEVRKLVAKGVPIRLGGHGQMPGIDSHWEMELLARGGLSPHQVLEIATINGARYHGLDRQIGSLSPGKLADLLVLNANPLENIRNTRAVSQVMKGGVIYDAATLAQLHPTAAPGPRSYFTPVR